MIQINDTLVSELVLENKFVCDLQACKGACCVEGDAGAPLEIEETKILKKIYKKVKPYLRKEGVKAIEEQGLFTMDRDEEFVTTLVDNKECAYVTFDNNGIAKCGIEQAYNDGIIDFRKPISCHLYPIRITKLANIKALNYSKWQICEPACECGAKLEVPVYRFLKDAICRKFGEDYFKQLEEADALLDKIKK